MAPPVQASTQEPGPAERAAPRARAARHPERRGRRPAAAGARAPRPADGAEGPGARGRHGAGQGAPVPGQLRQARPDRAGRAHRATTDLAPLALQLGLISLQQFDPVRLATPLLRELAQHARPHGGDRGLGQPRRDDRADRGGAVGRAREHAPRHGDDACAAPRRAGCSPPTCRATGAGRAGARACGRAARRGMRYREAEAPFDRAELDAHPRASGVSRVVDGAVPGVSAIAAPVFDGAGADRAEPDGDRPDARSSTRDRMVPWRVSCAASPAQRVEALSMARSLRSKGSWRARYPADGLRARARNASTVCCERSGSSATLRCDASSNDLELGARDALGDRLRHRRRRADVARAGDHERRAARLRGSRSSQSTPATAWQLADIAGRIAAQQRSPQGLRRVGMRARKPACR